jgi:DNA repair protein RecO (recombination protein O)
MGGAVDGATPAVILRSVALRESDLLVILLTLDHGKVEAIARGARRSKKRFAGGLPSGARGEATVQPARRGKFPSLSGFTPTSDHARLGRDLDAFAYANYVCELADRLTVSNDPDPRTFAALVLAIEDACGDGRSPAVLRRFELALLDALGLLPALGACAVCTRPVEGAAFDPERGGVLCPQHAVAAPREDPAVLDLARALAPGSTEAVAYADAPAKVRRGLRTLTQRLIWPHLKKPLKSLEFFADLQRGRSAP